MAAGKTSSSELHFLVSTGVEKPNPELRRFIRSHVMLGKNLGRALPPRTTRRRRRKENVTPSSTGDVEGLDKDQLEPLPSLNSLSRTHRVLPIPEVPRKFGSNMSSIRFTETIDPEVVEVVLQFSSIAKQVLFPLESCILFERRAEAWIAPLTIDPAFLHTMIFTSQYYFDAVLPQRPSSEMSQRSLPHYTKTLKLLHERFSETGDEQARLSFTTVAAVMGLTGYAHLMGDTRSARHHLKGLHKIVTLRGGISTLRGSAKLLVEILRCDIGMALHGGTEPIFFHEASEPFVAYPDLTPFLELQRGSSSSDSFCNRVVPFEDMNDALARAWSAMSEFCTLINFAAESKQYVTTDIFLDTMASVIYRLLDMRFGVCSTDEAICAGLLAFSCSIFLQWRQLGSSYPNLATTLKACLLKLSYSQQASARQQLWILMAGRVSVFGADDDAWLRPLLLVNMGCCEITSWSEMQELLQSFMWIRMVHEKPGKAVFDSAMACLNPNPEQDSNTRGEMKMGTSFGAERSL
ncbi:hypothetical protein B0H63DRAFT_105702 [Podospora didyma]|uniref:Transcription factor domain-containing protein n=1 Tax=Podospora didyma TaxID=330526 RepID=A0AAE0NY95_9PEZI|nr:hypothetical protein B0H63DRAFT_105702 [Podospora didyma]